MSPQPSGKRYYCEGWDSQGCLSHSCVSFYQDELMAELEELEQEELDKNLLEISGPETVPLPNVPSIALPSKPGEYFFSES